ncbi:hypothetical protein IWQ60_011042 [Tieghemiomyces parasiticus]|uniref:Cytochrome b5 heme-binding domain-containing protein n=1 Tax=Tieghemiomyces parasiticus TaxID=78921 RepID=A0A9W7ZI36_9FUNG|nr:hypothetical protein IWQ60_011042 [Tieghemiomyces parasiticus]
MSTVTVYTADQVAVHNKKSDLWCILDGKVYDITKFVDEHPGGEEVLLEHAGIDCSDAFEDVGHSEDAREMLAEFYVGDLDGASVPAGPPKAPVAKSTAASAANQKQNDTGSGFTQFALPLAILVAYFAYKYYAGAVQAE